MISTSPSNYSSRDSKEDCGCCELTEEAKNTQNSESTPNKLNLENNIKLFVGGLNYITLKEDLKSYFLTFGKVVECSVMFKSDGKSRCFGFVTIEASSEEKERIKEKIRTRKHEINGKLVDVKMSNSKEVTEGSTRFYVGNLNKEVDEDDLYEFFSKYGGVTNIHLMRDLNSGVSRNFCFVSFNEETISEVLSYGCGICYKGRLLRIRKVSEKEKFTGKKEEEKQSVSVSNNTQNSFYYWPDLYNFYFHNYAQFYNYYPNALLFPYANNLNMLGYNSFFSNTIPSPNKASDDYLMKKRDRSTSKKMKKNRSFLKDSE